MLEGDLKQVRENTMFLLVLEVIKKMLSIWLLSAGSVVVLIVLVLGIYRVGKFAIKN